MTWLLPLEFEIRYTSDDDESTRDAILGPLVSYNESKVGTSGSLPLVLSIRNAENSVIGGLWAHTAFGWLRIELLFVPEALRRQGVGQELMQRAETEAITRGCHSAWVDTFDFQARGFYERIGYKIFGQLDDYPTGSRRYFMMKRLSL